MSETPRITDIKARLAALPKIDPVKFKAACRELGPIDPFVYLAKATEKPPKSTFPKSCTTSI